MIGGLIIEPVGATWTEGVTSWIGSTFRRASAQVTPPNDRYFVEHVLFFQNDLNLRFGDGVTTGPVPDGGPIPNLADTEDPEDSGQKAFNYRTEPVWFRMGFAPDTPLEQTRTFDFSQVFTSAQVGGDPETPVFDAFRDDPVRFRLLHPGGTQRNHVFHLHAFAWEQTPYVSPAASEVGSTALGDSPFSYLEGARMGIGPTCHDDLLIPKASGQFDVPSNDILADFMYRDFQSFHLDGGLWGLFRVIWGF